MEIRVVLVSTLWWGKSIAVESSSECVNALISLQPCLNYLQENSNTTSPPCCSQFDSVAHSSPECLCDIVNGIEIDSTRALALPRFCNVQAPTLNTCNNGDVEAVGGGGVSSNGNSTETSLVLLFFLLVLINCK